jgi:Protein of unknown function (DUF1203)
MKLLVQGIRSDYADLVRSGGPDANGQAAVVRTAEGMANPCRHCLELIGPGDDKLVLAYRPFDEVQPYAEVGPIFLHKHICKRYIADELPAWFRYLQPAIIRGYGHDNWIRYETGEVIPGEELSNACHGILSDSDIAYVHIRSKFNCFQCRVDRG